MLARGSPINYEKIAQHCEKALELDPGNVKAIFRLGTALYHLGNLEKANQVLTSNPACQTGLYLTFKCIYMAQWHRVWYLVNRIQMRKIIEKKI